MEFYIILAVVCSVAFSADMILRYMEKIRSFGMETRLHNIKGKTIPIEDLVPHNLTMLLVFGAAAGYFGIAMKLLGLHPFISFPLAVAFGSMVNFTVMHFIKPVITRVSGDELPDKKDLSGSTAVCVERIPGSDYGRIALTFSGKKYEFEAISEYETDIEAGETVLILYRDGHFCVVEKQSEILDIINEKQNTGNTVE